jgi:hypothetical protein
MNLDLIVKESFSYSEVARKLGYTYLNGTILRKIKEKLKNCDCSHFDKYKRTKKYKRIEKECPVCHKKFMAKEGHKREKQTCSYACSNVFFRSDKNNGNWKQDAYRSTCFLYHKKRCVCCDEKKIVEVHHLDGNRKNNDPSNLIPLCPTHHQYWHSSYKKEVEGCVNEYIKNWLET